MSIAREQAKADDENEHRRIDELRRIFLDHLRSDVISVLQDIRQAGLSGQTLVERLEALRARFNLTIADDDEGPINAEVPAVIRIVCSDGLVK